MLQAGLEAATVVDMSWFSPRQELFMNGSEDRLRLVKRQACPGRIHGCAFTKSRSQISAGDAKAPNLTRYGAITLKALANSKPRVAATLGSKMPLENLRTRDFTLNGGFGDAHRR
jgi:hypothetical protein